MSLSPLLNFAIEAFEHAIKQYTDGFWKFSVLYCDYAIELIIKEKVRATKESIFEKNDKTIDFHDAIKILINNKGIKLPEKADLELIHGQRNIIQHRGATISKGEAEFYLKTSYEFIKRFLKDELGVDVKKLIKEEYHEAVEPVKKIEIGKSVKTGESGVEEIEVTDFISAILVEYRNLEIELNAALKRLGLTVTERQTTLDSLKILQDSRKLVPSDLWDFEYIKSLRNKAAHSDDKIRAEEFQSFSSRIQRLRNSLKALHN